MIQVKYEKDGSQGFILLPPQPAVLPKSDAGNDGVEPAPCFVIQNRHFPEGARPHLCIDEPKRQRQYAGD